MFSDRRPFQFFFVFFLLITSRTQIFAIDGGVDFCLVSMPKCGTHMSTKLLEMLTGRNKCAISFLTPNRENLTDALFIEVVESCRLQNHFIYGHTNPLIFGNYFLNYARSHPQTIILCPIRDLRDTVISYIFHIHDSIQAELGGNPSFEEMLSHVLNPEVSMCGKLLEMQAQFCLNFFQLPNVLIIRFEDLVGTQGGGKKWKQKKLIFQIAKKLNIPLDKNRLDYLCANLFGNGKKDNFDNRLPTAGTFRSGQIGSWKQFFKQEHYDLFKKYWTTYQIAFGYALDK